MMAAEPVGGSPEVRYEGPTEGGELWGGTQANFMVVRAGPDKESAVILNDAAAGLIAGHLGVENTPEWRELAARAAGEVWIGQALAGNRHVDSLRLLSCAALEADPGLLTGIEQRLRAG